MKLHTLGVIWQTPQGLYVCQALDIGVQSTVTRLVKT